MSDQFDQWAKFYSEADSNVLRYPSQSLVRIMKGDYIPHMEKDYKDKKVLDLGFGHGNNLLFLYQLGFSLYGVEIHQEICSLISKKLSREGIESDLRWGTNRKIPFPDNEFDFLVSWDVIHYEGNDENIRLSIKEYHRVLKPGGRILLSTVAPESSVLRSAKIVGPHSYSIAREDDFRKGEVFFCFDSPDYIKHYFSSMFRDIHVGRSTDILFKETVDSFVATGLKE